MGRCRFASPWCTVWGSSKPSALLQRPRESSLPTWADHGGLWRLSRILKMECYQANLKFDRTE